MRFDVRRLRKEAEEDYEKAWKSSLLFLPSSSEFQMPKRKGRPHGLWELFLKVRDTLLNMGFDEIENRYFVRDEDVYKQYGPEAPLILDRCFYLATLPRPELGVSREKETMIRRIVKDLDGSSVEKLRRVLRDYKAGRIEGDDLIETLVLKLGWEEEQATAIMDKVFPEMKKIAPVPTNLTLRSHMTATWFETLSFLQHSMEHPITLFSIGVRFRNEQKEDAGHLRAHYGASIVILDEDIDIQAGVKLTKEILRRLGFPEVKAVRKKATSKYYAPQTEYEIYVKRGTELIEIADAGMYSPIALANYGIEFPVFNAGFGLERMAMVLYGVKDARAFLHPQFFPKKFTDAQIASSITSDRKPITGDGRAFAMAMKECALRNKERPTPCWVEFYNAPFLGRKVIASLFKSEEGKKLLGPAALNQIYVYNGDIIAFTPSTFKEPYLDEVTKRGRKCGITYLDAVSDLFASMVEEAVDMGRGEVELLIKIARSPADVNIRIPEFVRRYVTSKRRRIDFRGPVFIGAKARITT